MQILKKLQDNKEVVLAAVKQNGCALQYASERLKDNKEVVLSAVSNYGFALRFASERLKDDEEVVLRAANNHDNALHFASERIIIKEIQNLMEDLKEKEDFQDWDKHKLTIIRLYLGEILKT